MSVDLITSPDAPPAVGPYSHASTHNGVLYCSGCIPLDAAGTFVGGDAANQAKQALSNLASVLAAGGAAKTDVLKTVVFLTDMADFASVNAVYAEFFGDHKPARSCVAVAQLPLGVSVEVEAIAAIPG
ncbi:MAG: Rid family detoxifying hydrolase [Pseudomonadota bacterium]